MPKAPGQVAVKSALEIQDELAKLQNGEGPSDEALNAKKDELDSANCRGNDEKMEELRRDITALGKIANSESLVTSTKEELAKLEKATREAKPVGTRVRELENKVNKVNKDLKKRLQKNTELQGQIDVLNAKVAK